MATYVNKSDVDGYFSAGDFRDLTDGDKESVFRAVSEQAEAEVNGYLRDRYTLPLPEPVDRTVKSIAMDIFRFRLYQRRQPDRIDEAVWAMYDRAVARLKDIQKGILVLEGAKASGDAPAVGVGIRVPDGGAKRKFVPGFTKNLN